MEACYTTTQGRRSGSNFYVLSVSNYIMIKKFRSFSLAIQFADLLFSSLVQKKQ